MKNRNTIQIIGIGVCTLVLGIICLAVPIANKYGEENAVHNHQFTDMEKETLEHDWVEKQVASALERFDKIGACEADICWSEGEIAGATVKVTMSLDGIGHDALETEITACVSRMLNISTESIVISFV